MYFVEKTRGINYLKQFDYMLFLGVIAITAIGVIVLHSATRTLPENNIMKTQIISLVIGIILAVTVSFLDYKDFKILGNILYVVSVIFLILVLFKGEGYEEWGSSSWLRIPGTGMTFQPSEIAKITFVMVTSVFFEKLLEEKERNSLFVLAFISLIPVVLVMLQPDYGTAIVFVFMFFVMLFIYGIKYRYILVGIGISSIIAPLIWFFALNDKRKERIITFLNPSSDPLDAGFQVIRSKMAIGAGQVFGQGLYNGIQTQSNGVPVKESDFIFSVIGEELGFIGASVLIAIVFFILLRCLYIAMNSRDMYGSFLVVGLTGMWGFHFLENIGMCVGVLPVTGIPLPFISAGGSAMLTNYFAAGIILSVSLRRKKELFEKD
jgi:rod shape determining protein RodA